MAFAFLKRARERAGRIWRSPLGKVVILGGASLGIAQYAKTSSTYQNAVGQFRRASSGLPPLPDTIPTRDEQLNKLKNSEEQYDILVIGGGGTGSGIALDATTRGYKVALVEREDFGSGTSSRSTKLIHGGVRYLERAVLHLDTQAFFLVWDALRERKTFMNVAPHLTNPLPIMTPCYQLWEVPYYYAGLKAYDILAGSASLKSSYFLTPSKSVKEFPLLNRKGLKGSVVYYDGQMDDARVNVSLALTAAGYGATISNYCEVKQIIKEDGLARGAVIQDRLSGDTFTVRSKVVINATGAFSDEILAKDEQHTQKMIEPSAGVHIILPSFFSPSTTGLIVPKTKDGRVVFMLPWKGLTLAGTTESPTDIVHHPKPNESDIEFILDSLRPYLRVPVRGTDVLAAWSGIRPLAREINHNHEHKSTAELSRDHVINVSQSKMVSIAGGKWTTYRKMAEDAVETVIKGNIGDIGKPKRGCQTKYLPLIGGDAPDSAFYVSVAQGFDRMRTKEKIKVGSDGKPFKTTEAFFSPMSEDIALHLYHSYGTRAPLVAEIAQTRYGNRLHENYPYLEAEVIYGATHEMACTAVDILARRTRLAFLDQDAAAEAAPRVVDLLGEFYKWNNERKQKEMQRVQKFLNTMKAVPQTPSGGEAQTRATKASQKEL